MLFVVFLLRPGVGNTSGLVKLIAKEQSGMKGQLLRTQVETHFLSERMDQIGEQFAELSATLKHGIQQLQESLNNDNNGLPQRERRRMRVDTEEDNNNNNNNNNENEPIAISSVKTYEEFLAEELAKFKARWEAKRKELEKELVQPCQAEAEKDLELIKESGAAGNIYTIRDARCKTEVQEWTRNQMLMKSKMPSASPHARAISAVPKNEMNINKMFDIMASIIAAFVHCGCTTDKQVEIFIATQIATLNRLSPVQEMLEQFHDALGKVWREIESGKIEIEDDEDEDDKAPGPNFEQIHDVVEKQWKIRAQKLNDELGTCIVQVCCVL